MHYTAKQAAAILGLTEDRIRKACARRQVEQFAGRWFISEHDLEHIRSRMGKAGRPRVTKGTSMPDTSDDEPDR